MQADASRRVRVDGPSGELDTHQVVLPAQVVEAVAEGWGPAPEMPHPAAGNGGAASTAEHRAALSALFPEAVIVATAGSAMPRANDMDYRFRADSVFAWLTGETAADAVLVMTPSATGHDAVLYIDEVAPPGHPDYFTDRRHGALWVGNAPDAAGTSEALGLEVHGLDRLPAGVRDHLEGDARTSVDVRVVGGGELRAAADELRLIKTDWEVDRLRAACDATARGFGDVVRELPALLAAGGDRGERWLEGTFWRRARYEGNDVGYHSIVAAGSHGTSLHWWHNTGTIRAGDLLLADMGIEVDELYTADITRTMPISGEWAPDQLRVYRAVLEAQRAAIDEVTDGAGFAAGHWAAMWVLADHLHSWGLIDVTADDAVHPDPDRPGAGAHRRYTLHRTSHMLGIDVHDCSRARDESYHLGTLRTGMTLTVEPGLYFQTNDRTVPADLRGIAVRIEDDLLVTPGRAELLSAAIPRDADELTAWMQDQQATSDLLR